MKPFLKIKKKEGVEPAMQTKEKQSFVYRKQQSSINLEIFDFRQLSLVIPFNTTFETNTVNIGPFVDLFNI